MTMTTMMMTTTMMMMMMMMMMTMMMSTTTATMRAQGRHRCVFACGAEFSFRAWMPPLIAMLPLRVRAGANSDATLLYLCALLRRQPRQASATARFPGRRAAIPCQCIRALRTRFLYISPFHVPHPHSLFTLMRAQSHSGSVPKTKKLQGIALRTHKTATDFTVQRPTGTHNNAVPLPCPCIRHWVHSKGMGVGAGVLLESLPNYDRDFV
jgi:hypothetical protein